MNRRDGKKPAADPELERRIWELIKFKGGGHNEAEVADIVENALKLLTDVKATGDVRVIQTALRELRYAFRIFAPYAEKRKVTIFGSARTAAGTEFDAKIGRTGQARVARGIRVTGTTFCSRQAASRGVSARSTARGTDTTVGRNKVVVQIHLIRLGAGFRCRTALPGRAIHIRLALIVASLIRCTLQRYRAIAVVYAMRFDGELTYCRLVAGSDATLSRGTVGRCMARSVALAPGAHQALVAVAVHHASATHLDLARSAAADHEPC